MSDFWTGQEPNHASPYWPYRKVVDADTLAGMEQMPYIVCRYLMDLPDGTGYIPPTDNSFPRVRLKKLLYYDGPLPLNNPCPTPEQIRQLFYDPENPDRPPDPERGYRIYPQNMVEQSIAASKSFIRAYLSDATTLESKGTFITRQYMIFDIIVNAAIESNTGMTASSRSYDILQAIKEATAGVNFGGVGPMTVGRITKIDDERYNTGYKIYTYMDWCADAPNPNFT